jgi:hypothetical protein
MTGRAIVGEYLHLNPRLRLSGFGSRFQNERPGAPIINANRRTQQHDGSQGGELPSPCSRKTPSEFAHRDALGRDAERARIERLLWECKTGGVRYFFTLTQITSLA